MQNNLNLEILNYVSSKSGNWADSTINTVYSKLRVAASLGNSPEKLYTELSARGYSRYTIRTYFTLISQFEKETKKTAHFENWTKSNRLRFKNAYREKTKKLSKEEFTSLLAKSTPHESLYNLLILTGVFGLRKSEAFNLRWDDFDQDRVYIRSGKGNKDRVLPFSKSLLKNTQNTGLILCSNMKYTKFIMPYTLHDFRAFAITEWVAFRGLNVKEAAVLAGHSSTATTDRYIRTDLRDIAEKLK